MTTEDKDLDATAEGDEQFEIDLGALDNDEIVKFESLLVAEYREKRASAASSDDVAELAAIKEVVTEVRAEMAKRVELAADDAFIGDVQGETFAGKFVPFKKGEKGDPAKQAAEADAEDAAEKEEAAAEVQPEVVISPVGLQGDKPAVTASASKPLAKIAADVRGFRSGQEVPGWNDVAKALINRHPDTRAADVTSGARFLVASIEAEYPEDRILGDDVVVNTSRVESVTSTQAIIASGGLCAPLTPWYNLQTYGDVVRPLRDGLPSFKADRGGIRFVTPPKLSDLSGSTRRTTAAQDAAGYTNQSPAGSTAPKPCLHVTCGTESTAVVQAVSNCLTFGNMGSRTYPEQVEAWLKLSRVEFARYQEQELLSAINAGSTHMHGNQTYGAAFSTLEQIGFAVDSFRARYRIAGTVNLRFVAPFWLKSVLKNDIAAQHPGDGLNRYSISDAQIEDWLRLRGVSPIWTQDTIAQDAQLTGPVAGGVLNTYPCQVRWFLFPEGQWIFLDNGVLDLGLVRDSTLNSQNDYQIWMEEFSAVAQVGAVESLAVVSDITPNGAGAPDASALRTCAGPTGPTAP
jgi:hypothetical protein